MFEKRLTNIPEHTPGKTRYFTYFLEWPDGSAPWVDQVPFVHPLQWELKQSRFVKDPTAPSTLALDLLRKGECQWTDRNQVVHRVIIESKERARRWGTGVKKPDLLTK
jgi:hypothetical protein